MPTFRHPQDTPGPSARPRPGSSASCLFLVILAANQAAAYSEPETLPYLVLLSPAPLRFATIPAPRPPPPRLIRKEPEPPPAVPPPQAHAAPASPAHEANLSPTEESSAAPSTAPSPAPIPPERKSELLPDTYAPPRTVTVQDFLPFFQPEQRPASRATYEVK